MTAEDIRSALRKRYDDHRRYAVAEEVGLTTGYSRRRLDMMVLDCYASNGFQIDGFEIKISTSDLRNELRDPDKHVAFFDIIDYYTIAAPAGVVDPVLDIMPKTWGILIVNEDGTTRIKRRPLALRGDETNEQKIPRGFLAAITRAIQSHQPSEQSLRESYEKGLSDGRETERRSAGYNREYVEKRMQEIDEYHNLQARLNLWGENSEEAINQFERFRALDPRRLAIQLQNASNALSSMVAIFGEEKTK